MWSSGRKNGLIYSCLLGSSYFLWQWLSLENSICHGHDHGAVSHAAFHESSSVRVKAISQVPSLCGPVDFPGHSHLQVVSGIISYCSCKADINVKELGSKGFTRQLVGTSSARTRFSNSNVLQVPTTFAIFGGQKVKNNHLGDSFQAINKRLSECETFLMIVVFSTVNETLTF